MAFTKIDRTNGDAIFVNELVTVIEQARTLHANLDKLQLNMAQMTTAQIEQFYGVAGVGAAVQTTITNAFNAINTDSSMVNIRTKIG